MAWFSQRLAEKLGLSPGSLVYIGDKSNYGPRITLTQFSPTDLFSQQFETWPQCAEKIRPGLLTWVHLEGLQDVKVVEAVGKHFDIHQMSLEDVLNTHHRPKMSDFETYLHFVFKLSALDPSGIRVHYTHANVIVGSNFLVSFVEKKTDALAPIYQRLANPQGRLRQSGPAYLGFSILDLFIDHFYVALSRIESAVDQMETQILRRPSDLLLGRLYEVKRETALMRKMSVPIREFIKSLNENPPPLIDEAYGVYYKDLEDHAVQIVDTCDAIKETLHNILDVSDSYSTHISNTLFKFFTVVSAIFLPLNFLASVYGMNFSYMPGLSEPAGFFVMTGSMLAIGFLLSAYFKIKRWW